MSESICNDSFQLYVDSLDTADNNKPTEKPITNPFAGGTTASSAPIDIKSSTPSPTDVDVGVITGNPFNSFNQVWQDFRPLQEEFLFQSTSADSGFFVADCEVSHDQQQEEDDNDVESENDIQSKSNLTKSQFSIDSFMIWNDPDSVPYSARIEQLKQQTPTDSCYSKLNTESIPNQKNSESSSVMNVVKKRGLFSRSTRNSSNSAAVAAAAAAASHNSGIVTVALNTPSSDGLEGFDLSPTSNNNSHHKLSGSSNSKSNGTSSATAGGTADQQQDEDRFNGDGVQFQGKLIGHEYVAEARGEQMCQQSLKKLKIIQKALGGHKQRINLYISFDGIKIMDGPGGELLFHHTVPQISFISRDETDTRAFGYVFGNSTTGHQFIGIKTKKEAMVIMSTIGQLFAITLKRKRNAEEAAALAAAATTTSGSSSSGAGGGGASSSSLSHSRPASASSSSVLPSIGGNSTNNNNNNEDSLHMYHSVYDMNSQDGASNSGGAGAGGGLLSLGTSSSAFIVPPPPSLQSSSNTGTLTGVGGRSNRVRHSRNTIQLSTNDPNVPIPVLPPPSSAHRNQHHHHHHHHNHYQSQQSLQQGSQPQHNHSLLNQSNSIANSNSNSNSANLIGNSSNNSDNLLNYQFDMFGPVSAPLPGNHHQQQQQQQSQDPSNPKPMVQNQNITGSLFDWANFDDDNSFGPGTQAGGAGIGGGSLQHLQFGGYQSRNQSQYDDTLNTISSISDANLNLSSSLGSTSTLNAQPRAGQTQLANSSLNYPAGSSPQRNPQLSSLSSSQNDSSTLVARYNQKNLPKNSSSSTIASSNFDGVDPFSDAFGEDPFLTASLGPTTTGLESSTAQFASQHYSVPKENNNRSISRIDQLSDSSRVANTNIIVPPPNATSVSIPLTSQFSKISLNSATNSNLDKSGGSFKSGASSGTGSGGHFSLQKDDPLSNSFSNRSIDSTSSADRYACLADIHSISTSIFDNFGNGGAVGGAVSTQNKPNVPKQQQQPTVQQQSSINLFGSSNFSGTTNQAQAQLQSQPPQQQNLFGSVYGGGGATGAAGQINSSNLFGPTGTSGPESSSSQYPATSGSPLFGSKLQSQPLNSQLSQWSTVGGGSTSSITSLPNFNSTSVGAVTGGATFSHTGSQQQLFGTGPGVIGTDASSSTTVTSTQPILFQELDPLGSMKAVSSGSLIEGQRTAATMEKPSYFMEPKQRQQFNHPTSQLDHSFQRNYAESNTSSEANSSASNTPPPPPMSTTSSRRPRFALKDQAQSLPLVAPSGGSSDNQIANNDSSAITATTNTISTFRSSSIDPPLSSSSSSSHPLIVSLPPSQPSVAAPVASTFKSTILDQDSLKFETSFDDNDDENVAVSKQNGATVEDGAGSSIAEFDIGDNNRKLSSLSISSTRSSTSSTSSVTKSSGGASGGSATASVSSASSVPVQSASKPALTRQSSREPTTTPPIPPRTDLLLQSQSQKFRGPYGGGAGVLSGPAPLPPAPPPPPPPPYSLARTSSSSTTASSSSAVICSTSTSQVNYQQQTPTVPYHHPYPPYAGGPYGPADPYISPNRYVGGGTPPQSSQWNQSAYEYLYQDPTPPIPPPYYRSLDPAAYHHHHPHYPPPPPPHPYHDYYRQSPYHLQYPDQNPYGWLPTGGDPYYHPHQHPHHQAPPPPPVHPQHLIYETIKSVKGPNTTSTPGSNCSTPPPAQPGESSSTPPLAPPPPPLPNPQRRISASSLQDHHSRFGPNTSFYSATMGRSNSSASTAPPSAGDLSSSSLTTPRTPPILYRHPHPLMPPYQYGGIESYGAASMEMSRFEYPEESYQGQSTQPPPLPQPNPVRRTDSLLQMVSPSTVTASTTSTTTTGCATSHQPLAPSSSGCMVASFNASMEQMIMKYHHYGPPSPLMVPSSSTGPSGGSLYSPIYPTGPHHHPHLAPQYSAIYAHPLPQVPQASSPQPQGLGAQPPTQPGRQQPNNNNNNTSSSISSNSSGSSSGYSTQSLHQQRILQQQQQSNSGAIYQQQQPNLYDSPMPQPKPHQELYDLPNPQASMKPLWDCSLEDESQVVAPQLAEPNNLSFEDNFGNSQLESKEDSKKDSIRKDSIITAKDSNNNNEVIEGADDGFVQALATNNDHNDDDKDFLEQFDTLKSKSKTVSAVPVAPSAGDTILEQLAVNSSSSPPERNIFIAKDDPFEDEFFKS